MNTFFIWFWSGMIFASIAWYTVLLFYLGVKGGIEIKQLTRELTRRHEEKQQASGRPAGV
jgi:hypothetical protein